MGGYLLGAWSVWRVCEESRHHARQSGGRLAAGRVSEGQRHIQTYHIGMAHPLMGVRCADGKGKGWKWIA